MKPYMFLAVLWLLFGYVNAIDWELVQVLTTPEPDGMFGSYMSPSLLIEVKVYRSFQYVTWHGEIWMLNMTNGLNWTNLSNFTSGQLYPVTVTNPLDNSVIVMGVRTGQDMLTVYSNLTIGVTVNATVPHPAFSNSHVVLMNDYLFTYQGIPFNHTSTPPDLWGYDMSVPGLPVWKAWTNLSGPSYNVIEGNAIVAYNGALYEFGGQLDYEFESDTYQGTLNRLNLNFTDFTYTVSPVANLTGRSEAALIMVESKLFVMGGYYATENSNWQTWWIDLAVMDPSFNLVNTFTLPDDSCSDLKSIIYNPDIKSIILVCAEGPVWKLDLTGYDFAPATQLTYVPTSTISPTPSPTSVNGGSGSGIDGASIGKGIAYMSAVLFVLCWLFWKFHLKEVMDNELLIDRGLRSLRKKEAKAAKKALAAQKKLEKKERKAKAREPPPVEIPMSDSPV